VSASEGAFAFLGTATPPPRRPLDASQLLVDTESTSFSIREGTEYAVGGRVIAEASSTSSVSFNRNASFASRIAFEEE
jgi:hypothetical protein